MRKKPRNALSAAELAELKGLATELHGLRKRWRRLAVRLGRARRSSVHALVRDRLLCVLHDCVAPALRDLRAIEAEARGPSNQEVIQEP